jgi:hypothetical protein
LTILSAIWPRRRAAQAVEEGLALASAAGRDSGQRALGHEHVARLGSQALPWQAGQGAVLVLGQFLAHHAESVSR